MIPRFSGTAFFQTRPCLSPATQEERRQILRTQEGGLEHLEASEVGQQLLSDTEYYEWTEADETAFNRIIETLAVKEDQVPELFQLMVHQFTRRKRTDAILLQGLKIVDTGMAQASHQRLIERFEKLAQQIAERAGVSLNKVLLHTRTSPPSWLQENDFLQARGLSVGLNEIEQLT